MLVSDGDLSEHKESLVSPHVRFSNYRMGRGW